MSIDEISDTIQAINNTIPQYELTSEGIVYQDAETKITWVALEWIPMDYLPKWDYDSDGYLWGIYGNRESNSI